MKRIIFTIVTSIICATTCLAQSQTQELPKFEVAAEFSSLGRDDFDGRQEAGLGARFTYNINRVVALETAAYLFPNTCFSCRHPGTITQVVGGVKVGKRFEKWGVFAKARPGVVSFSRGEGNFVLLPGGPPSFPFEFQNNRLNSFAVDAGAVVEFYPSKRIVTRFDAGDTIIHFKRRQFNTILFDPSNTPFIFPATVPSRTSHNFQFNASVGFRF